MRRLTLLASALALATGAACAADPTLPPVQVRTISEAPPAAPPPGQYTLANVEALPPDSRHQPCDALDKPLRDLRELASLVGLGRSMPIRPQDPARSAAEPVADARRARAVKDGDDTELGKLAAEAGTRLEKIAAAARTRGDEGARAALLDEMERGELSVQLAESKCPRAEGPAGRMSAAAIQRVVRPAFGEFKQCYEAGLRRHPGIHGTVRVRFTVARDGAVSDATDADADGKGPDPLAFGLGAGSPPVGDAEVRACVVAAFKKLVFPKPQAAAVGRQAREAKATLGGTFSATYPIDLSSSR